MSRNAARAAAALIALLSFLGLVGIAAYEYLSVTVPVTLSIASPDQANIALIPGADTWQGPGASSPTAVGQIDANYVFNINLGPWGKNYKVFFSNAFKIHNYDDEDWEFYFDYTSPTGVSLTFKYWDGSAWQTITPSTPVSVASGDEVTIGVEFQIADTASLGSSSFSVQILGAESGATGTPTAPGAPTG